MNKHIFVFWTGDNELSRNRQISLLQLEQVSQYPVVLVNKQNLSDFLIESDPLPVGYQYLSETHKSDFLRAYFMHYHGGGYADIKQTSDSWNQAFQDIDKDNIILCGYPEFSYYQIAHIDYKKYWNILIGCGGFISKPKTPLTTEWYRSAKNLIEQKTELLKQFPATHPQECSEGNGHEGIQPHGVRSNYPVEWNEILGRIFQPLVFKYRNFVSRTVPQPVIYNYR
jgi:hypothetical protein